MEIKPKMAKALRKFEPAISSWATQQGDEGLAELPAGRSYSKQGAEAALTMATQGSNQSDADQANGLARQAVRKIGGSDPECQARRFSAAGAMRTGCRRDSWSASRSIPGSHGLGWLRDHLTGPFFSRITSVTNGTAKNDWQRRIRTLTDNSAATHSESLVTAHLGGRVGRINWPGDSNYIGRGSLDSIERLVAGLCTTYPISPLPFPSPLSSCIYLPSLPSPSAPSLRCSPSPISILSPLSPLHLSPTTLP